MATLGYEYVESVSPGGSGFNPEGGKAVLHYLIPSEDLEEVCLRIIGFTSTEPSVANGGNANRQGRLHRLIPVTHPHWSWMYAERISEIKGLGLAELEDWRALYTFDKPLETSYSRYPWYKVTVEFSPRPYNLYEDDEGNEARPAQSEWYHESNPDAARKYWYTDEWDRFVTTETFPDGQLIQLPHGTTRLVTSFDDLPAAPQPNTVHGLSTGSFARIFISAAIVKMKWHHVPHSFVTSLNSNFIKYQGRVNQATFKGFSPGTLLYDSYTSTPFMPAFPDVSLTRMLQLCNIEMVFRYTVRPRGPAAPNELTPSNPNWIAAGHNMQPYLLGRNRGFYYAVTPDPVEPNNTQYWQPTFNSFPVQLLFANPDIADPV